MQTAFSAGAAENARRAHACMPQSVRCWRRRLAKWARPGRVCWPGRFRLPVACLARRKTGICGGVPRTEVAGQLSRVYLSIMRELAVRAGVPFAQLGGQVEHRLPDELLGISRKLHAFALGECEQPGLTEDEQRLLRDRYVHASANWNALKGCTAVCWMCCSSIGRGQVGGWCMPIRSPE